MKNKNHVDSVKFIPAHSLVDHGFITEEQHNNMSQSTHVTFGDCDYSLVSPERFNKYVAEIDIPSFVKKFGKNVFINME